MNCKHCNKKMHKAAHIYFCAFCDEDETTTQRRKWLKRRVLLANQTIRNIIRDLKSGHIMIEDLQPEINRLKIFLENR